jgi:hypothetical protein
VMLFRMIEILFGLFVGNSNGKLRRTAVILSSSQNSRITSILIVPEQQICVWIHNCYFYSENSSYSSIPGSSKHTLNILKKRRDHLTMGYLDNFDNGSSNKYKKILKIDFL